MTANNLPVTKLLKHTSFVLINILQDLYFEYNSYNMNIFDDKMVADNNLSDNTKLKVIQMIMMFFYQERNDALTMNIHIWRSYIK